MSIKNEFRIIGKLKPTDSSPQFSFSPDYVLMRLQKIVDDPEASNSDVLKALDLVGKYFKMWQGEQSVNVNIGEFLKDLTTSNVAYDDLLAKSGT